VRTPFVAARLCVLLCDKDAKEVFMKRRLDFAFAAAALLFAASASFAACGDDSDSPMGAAGKGGAGKAGGSSAAGKTAGSSAGTSGSASNGELTCAGAAKDTPAALHASAVLALLPTATNKSCAFTSCHDMSSHKAGLTLLEMPNDLRMQIVGKTSCEAPTYQLIDTSGGDTALEKSWLWQKLTAPAGSNGVIEPKSEWGTPVTTCGQASEGMFGLRMPWSNTDMSLTPRSKLEAIRDWICAGAPGPS
jgi:hypothetical protein